MRDSVDIVVKDEKGRISSDYTILFGVQPDAFVVQLFLRYIKDSAHMAVNYYKFQFFSAYEKKFVSK